MKIGEGVEWAAHAATFLAVLPPGGVLSGAALAEYLGVSESYLLKHLKALVKAEILESISGPKGGFRLAKPPERISLLDIAQALEGEEPAFRCQEIRQNSPACLEPSAFAKPCFIHATMLRAELAWKQVLREQTIADLARQVAQINDPEGVARVRAWVLQNLRGIDLTGGQK